MGRIVGILAVVGLLAVAFQNCGQGFKAGSTVANSSLSASPSPSPSPGPTPEPLRSVKWMPTTGRTYASVSTDGLSATKDDGTDIASRSFYADFERDKGVWYFEVRIANILSSNRQRIGLASVDGRVPDGTPTAAASYGLDFDGSFSVFETAIYSNYATTGALKTGDVVGVLYDLDRGLAKFYVNGVDVKDQTLQSGHSYAPMFFGSNNSNATVVANFGARPFLFAPAASYSLPDNSGVTIVPKKMWSAAESAAMYIQIGADGLTVVKDDGATATSAVAYANFSRAAGERWYFEATVSQIISSNRQRVGIASTVGRVPLGGATGEPSYGYDFNGSVSKHENGVFNNTVGGATVAVNQVIGVAVDQVGGNITFYLDGAMQRQVAIQKDFAFSPMFMGSADSNGAVIANFGATPFRYPAPMGYTPASM